MKTYLLMLFFLIGGFGVLFCAMFAGFRISLAKNSIQIDEKNFTIRTDKNINKNLLYDVKMEIKVWDDNLWNSLYPQPNKNEFKRKILDYCNNNYKLYHYSDVVCLFSKPSLDGHYMATIYNDNLELTTYSLESDFRKQVSKLKFEEQMMENK